MKGRGFLMNDNRLAHNIEHLLKIHDLKKKDLARSLYIANSTLTNYIKGTNKPDLETINKIAAFFDITPEQLLYEDLSYIETNLYEHFDNFFDNEKVLRTIFPYICVEENNESEILRHAYDLHLRTLDAIKKNDAVLEALLSDAIELYDECFHMNGSPIAATNMLSLLFLMNNAMIGSMRIKDEDININELENNYYINKKEFMRQMLLRKKPEKNSLDSIEYKKFVIIIDEMVLDLLKKLHSYQEYRDISDYYNALRYIYGAVISADSFATNRKIGATMMMIFNEMGNKYAKDYFDLFK